MWFNVFSAAMFFNYAVMCALTCNKLSVLRNYFSSNWGSGKNEIALPHENHNFYRLSNIHMQGQKPNISPHKQA